MKTLRFTASLSFLFLLFALGCQSPSSELVPASERTLTNLSSRSARSSALPADPVVVGPYTITFDGTTNDGLTWNYTIERTGDAQANGLSHWIINLGTCVTYEDVVSATIDGVPYTDLADTEGGGTDCNPTGEFLKFDNLPDNLSSGEHTFSFTLKTLVDAADVATYVKAGNACYNGIVTGPGCFYVCGSVTQELCDGTSTPAAFSSVTIINEPVNGTPPVSLTTTTDATGNFCFYGVGPGSNTVTVGEISTVVSVTTSLESVSLIIPAICLGCSYSQGYYFRSPVGIAASAANWPLTIGGESYSQNEGRTIFASRATGYANISNCFTQVATIKLSVALGHLDLASQPALANDVQIVETYLVSLDKLVPYSVFPKSVPKAAVEAAGRISTWINTGANHCTEPPL